MHSTTRPIFRRPVVLLFLVFWLPLTDAKPGLHPPFEITGMVTHKPDGDTIDIQTTDHQSSQLGYELIDDSAWKPKDSWGIQ